MYPGLFCYDSLLDSPLWPGMIAIHCFAPYETATITDTSRRRTGIFVRKKELKRSDLQSVVSEHNEEGGRSMNG